MRIRTILAVVLIAATPHVLAANINVPGDFLTIQDAVDAASDGDTIHVLAGRYKGAVVDKAVHIKGTGGTIVDTGVYVSRGYLGTRGFLVQADGVMISNLGIQNVGIGVEGYRPEGDHSVNDVAVSNVTITDPVPTYYSGGGVAFSFGVLNFRGGYGWTVTHSEISFADGFPGYGIYIRWGADSLVAFNNIEHHEQVPAGVYYFGVILRSAQYNKVVHNKILIDAEKKGCVGVLGETAMSNTIGFNDFRGSTVEGVFLDEASAEANQIKANLGSNRSSISDSDASDFKPIIEPQ